MVTRFDITLKRWLLGYWKGSTFYIQATWPE